MKLERTYAIRRMPGFRDSSGEYQPSRLSVDLHLFDRESRYSETVTIGEHDCLRCAQDHVAWHKAHLMPREGGEYAPFDRDTCPHRA